MQTYRVECKSKDGHYDITLDVQAHNDQNAIQTAYKELHKNGYPEPFSMWNFKIIN